MKTNQAAQRYELKPGMRTVASGLYHLLGLPDTAGASVASWAAAMNAARPEGAAVDVKQEQRILQSVVSDKKVTGTVNVQQACGWRSLGEGDKWRSRGIVFAMVWP